MRQFGELEAVIMDRLWEWGRPALVRDVVDDLNRDAAAGLHHRDDGDGEPAPQGLAAPGARWPGLALRAHRSRSAYTAALMNDALGTSPDRRTALAHFVLQMSPHDVKLLQQALDQARGEAPSPPKPRPGLPVTVARSCWPTRSAPAPWARGCWPGPAGRPGRRCWPSSPTWRRPGPSSRPSAWSA